MRIEITDKHEFSQMLMDHHGKSLETPVTGLTIDSRLFEKGDMYIPIKGERVNGHDFIPDILKKQPALVVSELMIEDCYPVFKVDNSRDYLASIAAEWRKQLDCTIIGITGSNGKTTSKELLWHILSGSMNCFKTQGNYNTVLSVPLSLLSISKKHDAAVIEIGTNKPGEIEYISSLVKPDIGLITNISHAHTEFFQSLDSIVREKTDLLKSLPESGIAVINSDISLGSNCITKAKIVSFGFNGKPDFKAMWINENVISINERVVTLPYTGFAVAQNALASFAAAAAFGINEPEISDKIESFQMPEGRGEVLKINDLTIINDSYNANPASMKAGLDRLDHWQATFKIAVLGDMFELGDKEDHFHAEIGNYLKGMDIDIALFTGERMKFAIQVLEDSPIETYWYSSKTEISNWLNNSNKKNTVIYIKGSRGMKMEKVIEGLR